MRFRNHYAHEKYYSPAITELDYATHVNPPRTVRFSVRYKL